MQLQWWRPKPDVLRHSRDETGDQASGRKNRLSAVNRGERKRQKIGGRSRHLRNPKSTGRAARGQPFPGIAMRDQKR
jgi:hypothetical protein